MPQHDRSLLQAALVGYQAEVERINTAIAQIQRQLGAGGGGGGLPSPFVGAPAPGRRRGKISAAGLKRIRAAQRKRWAEYHKAMAKSK